MRLLTPRAPPNGRPSGACAAAGNPFESGGAGADVDGPRPECLRSDAAEEDHRGRDERRRGHESEESALQGGRAVGEALTCVEHCVFFSVAAGITSRFWAGSDKICRHERSRHVFQVLAKRTSHSALREARTTPDPAPQSLSRAAFVTRSGPKSSTSLRPRSWARRVRARLTRLLMVPTATPQISAASSYESPSAPTRSSASR